MYIGDYITGVLIVGQFWYFDYIRFFCFFGSDCGIVRMVYYVFIYYFVKMRGNIGMRMLILMIIVGFYFI